MRWRTIGLVVTVSMATVAVVEIALGLAPAWVSGPQTAHPRNFRETRRSIEFEYEFRTNRYGLRDHDLAPTPAPGVKRILVIGDSFVEGYGVPDESRFTNRLEVLLRESGRPVEVINAGVTGAGPLQYRRLLEEVGLDLAPAEVLLCVYANDVANTPVRGGPQRPTWCFLPRTCGLLRNVIARIRELRRGHRSFEDAVTKEAARREISEDRIKRWRERVPQNLMDAVDRGEFNGRVLSYGLLYPEYWSDSIDIDSPRARARWQAARDLLTEIVDICGERQVAVRVVFIPSPFHHVPAFHAADHPTVLAGAIIRESWLVGQTEIQRRLEEWAEEQGVPFLDLTQTLRRESRSGVQTSWPLDGHWNPTGHAIVAGALAEWLTPGEQERYPDDTAR